MIHLLVEYQAKTGCEQAVKDAIGEFMAMVKKNEPGTLRYDSFMVDQSGSSFIHMVSFSDSQAKQLHESSSYVKHFALKIYPLCEQKPVFKKLELVDTNFVEAERLVGDFRNKMRRI